MSTVEQVSTRGKIAIAILRGCYCHGGVPRRKLIPAVAQFTKRQKKLVADILCELVRAGSIERVVWRDRTVTYRITDQGEQSLVQLKS